MTEILSKIQFLYYQELGFSLCVNDRKYALQHITIGILRKLPHLANALSLLIISYIYRYC